MTSSSQCFSLLDPEEGHIPTGTVSCGDTEGRFWPRLGLKSWLHLDLLNQEVYVVFHLHFFLEHPQFLSSSG